MPPQETLAPEVQPQQEARLLEENARLTGELEKLQKSHEEQLLRLRTESAIREGLLRQGAHDPRTVLPLLQLDKISLQEGRLSGLDEQLQKLRQENGYLFKSAQGPLISSGFSHERPPEPGGPATLAGALCEHYR